MNHFQQPQTQLQRQQQQQQQQQQAQQTHVAQQSRREKLRIPGSLHPSSPQSGNQSDHSAGSASVLEAGRHAVAPDDNFNVAAGRGYQTTPPDALPSVYSQNITSDPYSYQQPGSDLLAYASTTKPNGFLGAPGSGVLSSQHQQQQAQQQAQQQQQQGYSSQKNWSSGLSGGHFIGNPLSISGASGIHGTSSASSAVATASLLNGGGLQGSHHQLGRDSGPMTPYLPGQSSTQAEAMQLFLMNSGYSGYTDASSPGNMVLISGGSAGGSTIQGGSQIPAPGQQHFIGIPLTPSTLSQDTSAGGNGLASAAFAARDGGGGTSTSATYSGSSNWRNGDELLFMPSSEATQQRKALSSEAGSLNHIADINDYALRQSSLSSMLGAGGAQQSLLQATHRLELETSSHGHPVAAAAGPSYQSLSLSLSNPNTQLQALESGMSSPGSQDGKKKLSSDLSHFRTSPRDSTLAAGSSYVGLTNNVTSTFSFVSGSRYLRAAQQLLDEVCSVGRGIKGSKGRGSQGTAGGQSPTAITSGGSVQKDAAAAENNSVKSEITMGSSMIPSPGSGPSAAAAVAAAAAGTNLAPSSATAESRETSVAVLTQEEKQEHEGKKTKLLAMLQEVDRRYRQYYDQMQVVITSFDAVAGVGAATPYTALALQAMSRYFRCLRDAITGQIQVTCKALGEEDVTKSITSRPLTSRLRFIDQQIRQQRAYQQYGMLQQHAWRPQRGLPERSVSILRAWLFEHFLHPYPKDADKLMLARQTGLTRSQVSNWFINARVRLWKPMVEEMYQEETKEQELAMSGRAEGGSGEDKHNHDTDARDKHPKHHQQQQHHDHHIQQQQDMMQMEQQHQPQNYTDYPSMMTMRKSAGIEAHVFNEQQQQLAKKTRLGIHDSSAIAVAAAVGLLDGSGAGAGSGTAMDVEVKPDNPDMRVHYQDHYAVSHHHHQHHHHQNGPLDSNFVGRYSSAGFQQQQQQQQQHYPGSSSVSLTLGLRHCDSLQLGGSGGGHQFVGGGGQQQHGFMATRHHISADSNDLSNIYGGAAAMVGGQAFAAGGGHHHHLGGGDHDGIDYQGGPGRKQPHMEGHLLHDFVA